MATRDRGARPVTRLGFITFDRKMVEFDDRVLAHLQAVIVQPYRAGQPFRMPRLDPLTGGDGRSAAWMTPHMPVPFHPRNQPPRRPRAH